MDQAPSALLLVLSLRTALAPSTGLTQPRPTRSTPRSGSLNLWPSHVGLDQVAVADVGVGFGWLGTTPWVLPYSPAWLCARWAGRWRAEVAVLASPATGGRRHTPPEGEG